MTDKQKPVMVVSRDKAVFRLDKNGIWYLGEEKFTNQKIIDYFHSVIKKDEDGYYLEQEHKHFLEKVYFPYEETALFVFHIIKGDGLILHLNTGEDIRLDPEKLFMKDDNLYFRSEDDLIKFHEKALFSMADYLDESDGQYLINIDGRKYPIPEDKA